jgi:outer membrane protein assembly factor BamB
LRLSALVLAAFVVAGCSSSAHVAAPQPSSAHAHASALGATKPKPGAAQLALRLPPIARGPLPGYLLIADRNNNRAIIVSPSRRIVWERDGLRGPDDTFFTPGYRGVITNEEFNDTLTQVSLRTKSALWRYGHDGVPGSSAGYLNTPDDAYRLRNGDTIVADIRNCRIVELTPAKRVLRILGGSCVHDPPSGFASPNGDTPLPDGGILVTEIGGWIDRLAPDGRLDWSIRSPVSYPSDAQLLPNGSVLVAGFTDPGKIVEVTRTGRVTWSFGSTSGPDRLDKPSLAVRLPNGYIAATDDWNHRVIVVDPRTKAIVWQYGRTGVAGAAPGLLDKPDGLDLLPSAFSRAPRPPVDPVAVRRIGTLPFSVTKSASVALPGDKLVVLGGEGSDRILAGPPSRLHVVGHLPTSTHDAAAVLRGGVVLLYGGGASVSTPAVVQIDSQTAATRTLHPLDEPLSDLGAARIRGNTYLVGGFTGTTYASAILRVDANDRTTTVARLPTGTRYAGIATSDGKIYVAGGLTTQGESRAVYEFDPQNAAVVRIGSLPTPEAHAALAALGGALYLFGGRSVLRISPETGTVTRVATLPQALSDPNAVTVGRRIVVLGGGTNAVYALTTHG